MTNFTTKLNLNNEGFCQTNDSVLALSGCTYIISTGRLKYCTDQSSLYVARSVVDAGFVTGLTSPMGTRICTIENLYFTGVTNGITLSGKKVKLGGALTGNTTITGAHSLSLCNGALLNTQCGYQISGNTIFRTSITNLS